MNCITMRVASALLTCAVLACGACAAQPVAREDLGRTVKLMVLVDKVMQPVEGWTTKEWMIAETRDAGFNVFSPRRGYNDLEAVRQVTEWCEKHGIYHMPWMRGTLEAPTGPEADGKRLVWTSGLEQSLWSPNADEFWDWTTRYIVEYAKISAQNPHLMGVFLDYENYSPGKPGNCYDLSYDDIILGKFAADKGIELPALELSARRPWLDEQGLHDDFAAFQVDHWRERCRALREAVDEHDPAFQFCIYPAPGTRFMVQAAYPEWSTEAAPLILADPRTYGRPSRFLPQAPALERNREALLRAMQVPQDAGIPFIYAGGIDPVVPGADPEFCGKNAVMISEITDGYWVFYEGPRYYDDHPEHFRWFTWANRHIAAGNLAAWHESRETPEDFGLGMFEEGTDGPRLAAPPVTGERAEFPAVRLRRDNMLALTVRAGLPVEVVLRNIPVARHESPLVWELRDARMSKLAEGAIPHNSTGAVTFTPEADGICFVGLSSGPCAYSLLASNVPVGLLTMQGLSLIFGAERLYFSVPADVEEFTIRARGYGAETVRVNVYDPEGEQVATGQTTPRQTRVTVTAPAGEHAGRVWALELARADEGVWEDHAIQLDPKLPPVVSLLPEHVFASEGQP